MVRQSTDLQGAYSITSMAELEDYAGAARLRVDSIDEIKVEGDEARLLNCSDGENLVSKPGQLVTLVAKRKSRHAYTKFSALLCYKLPDQVPLSPHMPPMELSAVLKKYAPYALLAVCLGAVYLYFSLSKDVNYVDNHKAVVRNHWTGEVQQCIVTPDKKFACKPGESIPVPWYMAIVQNTFDAFK
ncbi:hypothetical protein PT7_3192 [Pusillimonas sp. T7-7]|nr:hypothetical protein PT7_3192 [Pusillimonas sp. T7-7]